jgi:hypothetical protein
MLQGEHKTVRPIVKEEMKERFMVMKDVMHI